ncbi:hypothetical protein [Streptomyces aureus]|uniref:hypothetical protein n=1 Tax=Streptomyces aureus TaxID=193461 RepID=UPI0031DC6B9E
MAGVAALAAALVVWPTIQGNARDDANDKDEKKKEAAEAAVEAGQPLKLSPGVTYYGPSWYVSETSYGTDQLNGQPFKQDGGDAVPSWAWLRKNWIPLATTGTAVTVESQYKVTVVVQALELRDVNCTLPLPRGTLLQPPTIGDGGEVATPVSMGMRVDSLRPITRTAEGSKLGGPYTRQVALNKGDAREVNITFTAEKRACSFQARLVVNSKGKQYRLRLPATWKDGKPDSYTFTVAPPRKPYKSHYVVGDGNMLVAVPETDIKWKDGNPAYTGNGELSYW